MNARSIISLLALLPVLAFAQIDPLVEAYQNYRAGDLENAKVFADKAIGSPEHKKDPEAWLLHGFIHKDLYKSADTREQAGNYREIALESLAECVALDDGKTYTGNAMQAYDYMARSFYNDAAKALNDLKAERATDLFEKYKKAILRMDPDHDLTQRDAEFHNAIGTVYTKQFNQHRDQIDRFELAVAAYKRVLELDPGNYGANYNLATLYYNRGVYNIRSIKADDDIPSIQQIQEVSKEFFQLALPYMLKAHDMKPDRRETLLGLEGIYYSLQDQESSDKFRQLFEELPPQEQDR